MCIVKKENMYYFETIRYLNKSTFKLILKKTVTKYLFKNRKNR